MAAIALSDMGAKLAGDIVGDNIKRVIGDTMGIAEKARGVVKDYAAPVIQKSMGVVTDLASSAAELDPGEDLRQRQILEEEHQSKLEEVASRRDSYRKNKTIHDDAAHLFRHNKKLLENKTPGFMSDAQRKDIKKRNKRLLAEARKRSMMGEEEKLISEEPNIKFHMKHKSMSNFLRNNPLANRIAPNPYKILPDTDAKLEKAYKAGSMFGKESSFGTKLPYHYDQDYFDDITKAKKLPADFLSDNKDIDEEGNMFGTDIDEEQGNRNDEMTRMRLAEASYDPKLMNRNRYYKRRASVSSLSSLASSLSSIPEFETAEPQDPPPLPPRKKASIFNKGNAAKLGVGLFLASRLATSGVSAATDVKLVQAALNNNNNKAPNIINVNTQGSTYRV
jgi:hypothetical protein